jgi:predicted alpha/beta hydrolase family esterase
MKINIPGLHNSDDYHWQTLLEQSAPNDFKRIIQENWDEPDCNTWINKIEEELKDLNYSELILIGHSIGCVAIVKWFERFGHIIKGALLVAPSDSESKGYPKYISGFVPIPQEELPFPTIVVASNKDHVTEIKRSSKFAKTGTVS